jgi:hypothetical protein
LNERVIEVRELLQFIEGKDIKTVLDVGAYGSPYLKLLHQLGLHVTGIDNSNDPKTPIEHFVTGNVVDKKLEKHDLVTCISTIEHAGVQYESDDYQAEQLKVFKKILSLTGKYFFITFPFGRKTVLKKHYTSNIDIKLCDRMTALLNDYNWNEDFYYNPNPSSSINMWLSISKNDAKDIPLKDQVTCVCILKGVMSNE